MKTYVLLFAKSGGVVEVLNTFVTEKLAIDSALAVDKTFRLENKNSQRYQGCWIAESKIPMSSDIKAMAA